MADQSWTYIARNPVELPQHAKGTVLCAVVDRGDKHTADAVAEWIRDGLTIERVPTDWVRKFLFTTEPYIVPGPHG